MALRSLAHLPPALALLSLTAGILLLYVELNRPGWIVPGAVGLSLTLLAVASLLRLPLRPSAFVLIATAVSLLLLNLLRPAPRIFAAASSLALVLGFLFLFRLPAKSPIYILTATLCGFTLSAGSIFLAGIARRARRNKRGKLKASAF